MLLNTFEVMFGVFFSHLVFSGFVLFSYYVMPVLLLCKLLLLPLVCTFGSTAVVFKCAIKTFDLYRLSGLVVECPP